MMTISACKNAEKYAISTLIFFKFFTVGIAPDHIPGRGYGAHPLIAPELRASRASLGTFGPSIVRKRERED